MNNKPRISRLLGIFAVPLGVFGIFVASPADASQGQHLCGLTAPTKEGGYVGLLYLETDSNAISCASGDAIKDYRKLIANDRILAEYRWTEHKIGSCEEVGILFRSTNSPLNMCTMMTLHKSHKVVKDPVKKRQLMSSWT